MSDTRIYIVSHNAKDFPVGKHFQPIQSGRALNPIIDGTIGDDTGDNISELNPFFAEIAPMYWVWKNASPAQMVGFFHYRRFLNFGPPLAPEAHWSERNFHDFSPASLERFGWTAEGVVSALNDCDIAVPELEIVSLPPHWQEICSLYDNYRNAHGPTSINVALDVLQEIYPEDATIAQDVMGSSQGYFCHMYVMRWQVFCDYMQWIFNIFNILQNRIDIYAPYYSLDSGQQRIFGFIGERFFNIYVEKMRRKGLRIKEFERLFGLVQASPGKAAPPRKSRERLVQRIHRGIEFNLVGRKLSLLDPD
jgi:hypothetical protein